MSSPRSGRARTWLAGPVWFSVALGVSDTWSVRGAEPATVRSCSAAVVSIEEGPGGGRATGSGVVVSAVGQVVTTWSTVSRLHKASIRLRDGSRRQVTGVAAADRASGLVLLATSWHPPATSVPRLVDRDVTPGQPVHAVGGPACEPLVAASDRLDTIEHGERFLSGLGPGARLPVAPDQCRLVHHAYLGREASGGGLFGDDGLLLGVLVESPDWSDRVHVAIHAGHVRALVAAAGRPRPLRSLARIVVDPPPSDATALARRRGELHLPPFRGDAILRGVPLRDRLRALREAIAALPAERRRLALRAMRWEQDAAEPQRRFERVQREIAENRVAYASIEPSMEIRDGVALTASDSAGGIAGDAASGQRAFSPEQRLIRERLDAEYRALERRLAAIHVERVRWSGVAAQGASDSAALDRQESALLRQVFFAADPFATHDRREIRDALPELDAEIAQGRPAAVFLLVRGGWYCRLRRWDEALADFDRIADEDRSLVKVAALAIARCRALRDGRDAAAHLSRLPVANRADPILDSLRARIALDVGDWTAASRSLQDALDHGGDPGTLHDALARVALVADLAPRVAADHARLAAVASLGTDWRAWGLRGLASAASGDGEAGEATLHAAEALATGDDLRRLRAWRVCVRDGTLPGALFDE